MACSLIVTFRRRCVAAQVAEAARAPRASGLDRQLHVYSGKATEDSGVLPA
jgi:hypothetical protein